MSIQNFIKTILTGYESTFKETSLDDRGGQTCNYLCKDTTKEVFNFDKYVKDTNSSPLPSSPDAIYVENNKVYFVEFKNSPLRNINEDNIKKKFNSGTQILKVLLCDFLQSEVEFIFCVVYKSQYQYTYFNPIHIINNISKFGLESENSNNDSFYSKIITQDVDFYKRSFSELSCI